MSIRSVVHWRTTITLALAGYLLPCIALFLSPADLESADTVLVETNATWKYRDDGSNQGTAWRSRSFNDTTWAPGPAQLGYGDGDEATIVNCGSTAPRCNSNNFITTYFRTSFSVADPSSFTTLKLSLLRDDGAVVYLNGSEVRRDNMPTGSIAYKTKALSDVKAPQEPKFYDSTIPTGLLTNGQNVIAVEVHQRNRKSPDLSFALALIASDSANVTRGPYLQQATPASMTVRWRTDSASDSFVRYGTSPGSLTLAASNTTVTAEHIVEVDGLEAATRYYYSVGTSQQTVAGGADFSFVTPPVPGTPQPTRIWVLGDSGTPNANAVAVRNAYRNFAGNRSTDLWLLLGDNAYQDGTDAQYQAALFNMHPTLLRQTPVWSTIGNHDTTPNSGSPLPYLQIFTLPTNGEAGGLPSGTERYYSFDYANIHFVCLDSMSSSRATNGPMLTWLLSDLDSSTYEWLIAFWHHPPYSKNIDSDTTIEEKEMRQNALPILEAAGVDLVLSGHSHSYERSYLLNGHYGDSTTLTSAMKVDGGSGREKGSGAYEKPPGGTPNAGAVYLVAGSGCSTASGPLNHPAMFISLQKLGSVVLDIEGNRLDAKFLRETGATNDFFTIIKTP